MKTDQIINNKPETLSDSRFENGFVNLFEEMVTRFVPMYHEIQRMIGEIVPEYAKPGTSVYDLGCSTGTTLLSLNSVLDESIKFVGVDFSKEMLECSKKNFIERNVTREYELLNYDLNKHIYIRNASVVILCLTLQFVRPANRFKLLKSIQEQINSGGCIIVFEKVIGENAEFNRKFTKYYNELKIRNNWKDIEKAHKWELSESDLIPYKLSENIQLLLDTGFHHGEIFFKWHNFTGLVAIG